MNTQEINKTLEAFLENPYWAEYYNNAPSLKCKEYIKLEFYYSDSEDEDIAAHMDEMEKDFSLDDLKHLLKYCNNGPRKLALQKRIVELTAKA